MRVITPTGQVDLADAPVLPEREYRFPILSGCTVTIEAPDLDVATYRARKLGFDVLAGQVEVTR